MMKRIKIGLMTLALALFSIIACSDRKADGEQKSFNPETQALKPTREDGGISSGGAETAGDTIRDTVAVGPVSPKKNVQK